MTICLQQLPSPGVHVRSYEWHAACRQTDDRIPTLRLIRVYVYISWLFCRLTLDADAVIGEEGDTPQGRALTERSDQQQ